MDIRRESVIEKKVFDYIEANNMVAPHDKIVVGVSGGADSVCLLFLLLKYAKKVPLSLAVVHIDHCIRAESGEDAKYVEELCRKEGIPFFLNASDVHGLALEQKCSEEDMGRRVRYRAFWQAAEELNAATVAVAHNSNDNAETMLFHLFRGSGLKGLGGIAPVRQEGFGKIIRPILCLERQEVEAYLKVRGICWRMDITNSGDHYRRNRIRHHILPYVEQEVAQGAVGHMCQTADMLRETENYLEMQTVQALEQCLIEGKDTAPLGKTKMAKCYRISVKEFGGFHIVLQKRMLLSLLKELSPTGKDISMVHVHDALSLFWNEGNRTITLPFGIKAWRQYGEVIIECGKPAKEETQIQEGVGCSVQSLHGSLLAQKEKIVVPFEDLLTNAPFTCYLGSLGRMEFSVFFIPNGQKVPRNQYTKWFDYDKIKEPLIIRTRNQGDFLTIGDKAGKMRHKSLKDYMIAEKIPKQFRDEIPVVATGSHVLWLTGWRISEYFKVNENTKQVLQVKLLQDPHMMPEADAHI